MTVSLRASLPWLTCALLVVPNLPAVAQTKASNSKEDKAMAQAAPATSGGDRASAYYHYGCTFARSTTGRGKGARNRRRCWVRPSRNTRRLQG